MFITEQSGHLVAGLSGGFISTLALHPLDLLKIRFAVNEGDERVRPQQRNYWRAARAIVGSRGLLGLYQGAVPNLLGNTLAWGSYFYFYNIAKNQISKHVIESDAPLSAAHFVASGILAGVATLTLTNPVWVVKTRLCLQYEGRERVYAGFVDALAKTYRSDGWRGLYKGYLPGVVGTSHGALQFMAYELLKRRACEFRHLPADSQLSSTDYLACSAVSKSAAVLTTYPYQVVRSRLQDQHARYGGIADVVRRTWRGEGARGFYKGLLPSLLRVTPATCIIFVVYENVSHSLKPLAA